MLLIALLLQKRPFHSLHLSFLYFLTERLKNELHEGHGNSSSTLMCLISRYDFHKVDLERKRVEARDLKLGEKIKKLLFVVEGQAKQIRVYRIL